MNLTDINYRYWYQDWITVHQSVWGNLHFGQHCANRRWM